MRALALVAALALVPAVSFAERTAKPAVTKAPVLRLLSAQSYDGQSVVKIAGPRPVREEAANRLSAIVLKAGHNNVETKHGFIGDKSTIRITGDDVDFRPEAAMVVERINNEHATH